MTITSLLVTSLISLTRNMLGRETRAGVELLKASADVFWTHLPWAHPHRLRVIVTYSFLDVHGLIIEQNPVRKGFLRNADRPSICRGDGSHILESDATKFCVQKGRLLQITLPSNMQRIEPTRFCDGTVQDRFSSMQFLSFFTIQLHHRLFFGLIGSAGASTSACEEHNSIGPPTFTPIPIGWS